MIFPGQGPEVIIFETGGKRVELRIFCEQLSKSAQF
jgi:hypothetical protein